MIETVAVLALTFLVSGALLACGAFIGMYLMRGMVDDYRHRLEFHEDTQALRIIREERWEAEQDRREQDLFNVQAQHDARAILSGELRICEECGEFCERDDDDDEFDPIETMQADAGANGHLRE